MAQQQSRSVSLGRSPSEDYIKRRKSLQEPPSDSRLHQTPDVRSFLGKRAARQVSSRVRAASECSAFPWHKLLRFALATVAIVVTAGAVIIIIAAASHSSVVYTQWVEVRDGTTIYVQQLDEADGVVLLATFLGAALIVVLVYALFSALLAKYEVGAAMGRRKTASFDQIVARDLEQGDVPLKTRQSIAKLMSDAEKQYVAEYLQKSATPGSAVRKQTAAPPNSQITVQKLGQGSADSAEGQPPQGIPRSWSLKRMLSLGRAELQQNQKLAAMQDRSASPERGVPSSEMAAQLSSPDAFNRASSSYAQITDSSHHSGSSTQDPDFTPNALTLRELLRQRRDVFGKDIEHAPPATGGTRIMVTKPIESHGDGSTGTESEEDDFDRERQHSVLPHPASDPPFGAKVLRRFPRQGLEEVGKCTSLGWQSVGLDSDEEARDGQAAAHLPPGHIRQEGIAVRPDAASEPNPAAKLELRLSDSMEAQDRQVKCYIDLELEEVLPRPQAGLLNRLLRLARVDRVSISSQAPVFVINPGKEYMVGLRMRYPTGNDMGLHAKWLRIQPPDGQPVRYNVEEESSKAGEWSGSACWDTTLHSSELLTSTDDSKAEDGVSIHVTIGLANSSPGSWVEAHGSIGIILHAALQNRVRGDEERSSTVSKAPPVASYCLL